jgi:hypothetical protein
MTPQIAKRKDGLCPSLLEISNDGTPPKEKPGHVFKSYQTNSGLFLQIKEREGIPREVTELQTLIESVNRALKTAVANEIEPTVVGLKFKPEGCIWKMEVHFALGEAHRDYKMEVICSANNSDGVRTNYLIDSILIPKLPLNKDPMASPPDGFKDAKLAFDLVAIAVRKSIVRLEFPDFPEGCKKGGAQFRDVYQLNARVSTARD